MTARAFTIHDQADEVELSLANLRGHRANLLSLKRPPPEAETDRLADRIAILEAAHKTMRWVQANEDAIRDFVAERTRAKAEREGAHD